jgi:DNA-binding response OmpR family regulator
MIRELRGGGSAVKILAMSGGGRLGSDEILKFAVKLGADECIAKPFTAKELLDKVGTCLSKETVRI